MTVTSSFQEGACFLKIIRYKINVETYIAEFEKQILGKLVTAEMVHRSLKY